MDVVETAAGRIFFRTHGAVFSDGIGANGNSSKTDQAIGNAGNVCQTCGLEEGDFDAKLGGHAGARTNRKTFIFFVIFFARGNIFGANGYWKYTIPFNIGEGINEFALAFGKEDGKQDANQIKLTHAVRFVDYKLFNDRTNCIFSYIGPK